MDAPKIFTIEINGVFLNLADDAKRRDVETLIHAATEKFLEAQACHILFYNEYIKPHRIRSFDGYAHLQAIRSLAVSEVRSTNGWDQYYFGDDFNLEVDRFMLEHQISRGQIPDSLTQKNILIHAHSFLYSLDQFVKF